MLVSEAEKKAEQSNINNSTKNSVLNENSSKAKSPIKKILEYHGSTAQVSTYLLQFKSLQIISFNATLEINGNRPYY